MEVDIVELRLSMSDFINSLEFPSNIFSKNLPNELNSEDDLLSTDSSRCSSPDNLQNSVADESLEGISMQSCGSYISKQWKDDDFHTALSFVEKSIEICGSHSSKFPSQKYIQGAGMHPAKQRKARDFLRAFGAISVNFRTELNPLFPSLKTLFEYLIDWNAKNHAFNHPAFDLEEDTEMCEAA